MFTIEVVGAQRLIARFDAFPAILHRRLLATIRRLAVDLQAYVQRNKLQGQALAHRIGKLSASIEQLVVDNPDSILAKVFSNGTVKYAAAHEFGFDGEEQVGAHTRTQTMVFGRPIDPILVSVASFSRHMHIPERSFLRASLAENAGAIEAALTEAAATAWGATD